MDYLQISKAFAQAVAEIRALAGSLLGEGCPLVVLWGVSWGAWLAGLTISRDARVGSAVLAAPAARLNLSKAESVFPRSVREAWLARRGAWERLNETPVNLTSSRPAIPRENILLVEPIYDGCVGSEPVEELWEGWGRPDIWRVPHGHISFMAAPGVTRNVLRWLKKKHPSAFINRALSG